ncbi:MAG TPA: glycosyltransferase family 39 protein [Acidimicrobiia bacterium]|nr:glycosyltransferase family 39 protein [Acidimicrobiia bacterium]
MTVVSDAPAREPVAETETRPHPLVVFALAAVVAIGVGFFSYTRSDLWLDEALSVNIARLPFSELRAALERDGAPPLYYALLHVWTSILGTSDVAVRSLSTVIGLGLVTAVWFAARRFGSRSLAWSAVVLTFASPYAIRYATEARMYGLEMLFVALGIIAVDRAFERPSYGRLLPITILSALLVYTQYWGFYILGVLGLVLLFIAWRKAAQRATALRIAAAVVVGVLTFLPWIPTFMSQRAHTGTPWGDPVLPGLPIGETFLGFAGGEEQEGWLLLLILVPLMLLGAFGRRVDDRHVDIDVRVQRPVRGIAFMLAVTLVAGTTLSYLAGQAFEPRYSAIVFPFFVILAARGVMTLGDRWIRVGVLVVVVSLGFAGGVRNVTEQRTQAGQVAAVLKAEAQPGDVVVYCPDQLAPAVHRLLGDDRGLDEVTYPAFGPPAFVDWTDYQERLDATDHDAFAQDALARAEGKTLWYVTGPGYPNHHGVCEAMADSFGAAGRERIPRVLANEDYFEKPGLVQFPAPTSS